MKRYVVSYISFFDNDLKSGIIEAENEQEACIKYMVNEDASIQDWISSWKDKSLEVIKYECFNADSMINVIEI